MNNIAWLTSEAHRLHNYFGSIFYLFVTVLLVVGVLTEYFRFPLGQVPSFAVLVGRAFVAILLLSTYSEVANNLALISDSLTQGIGGFNNLDSVLSKMGEKVDSYSSDWLSAKSLIMTVLSILTYTFLFYSVIIAEAAHVFTWTLLYVFSPMLIALFVIPATSGSTKALYRSLIEVCCWKVVWATLAALLWSSVLVEMNSGTTIDFVKMICINLILGGSLLATPWIVHALATSGLAGFTRSFAGVVTAAGFVTPFKAMGKMRQMKNSVTNVYGGAKNLAQRTGSAGINASKFVAEKTKEGISKVTSKIPPRKEALQKTSNKVKSSQIKSNPIVPSRKG